MPELKPLKTRYSREYGQKSLKSTKSVLTDDSITKMSEADVLIRRSRGVFELQAHFKDNVVTYIKEILKKKKQVKILEIGFGEGRCLLELAYIFSNFAGNSLKLYGINLRREGGVYKKNDLLKNAKKFGLKISSNLLPEIYFYDAGEGLKFKSNFFDLIISQTTFLYIGDKAKLLEEIWRTLKFGGKALIQADGTLSSYDNYKNYPNFLKENLETPRFLIYKKNKLIRLSKYLEKICPDYDIKITKNKFTDRAFVIRKNRKGNLKLNLKYDKNSSLVLHDFRKTNKITIKNLHIWNGIRSIHKVI